MSKQQIYDFLNEFDLCSVCILRYLNGRCIEFENVEKAYQDVSKCLVGTILTKFKLKL